MCGVELCDLLLGVENHEFVEFEMFVVEFVVQFVQFCFYGWCFGDCVVVVFGWYNEGGGLFCCVCLFFDDFGVFVLLVGGLVLCGFFCVWVGGVCFLFFCNFGCDGEFCGCVDVCELWDWFF